MARISEAEGEEKSEAPAVQNGVERLAVETREERERRGSRQFACGRCGCSSPSGEDGSKKQREDESTG